MSDLLTPKQEKFCRCIVSGMSAKDSYMESYDSKSERTAYNEGNKLLMRDDITERIKELSIPVKNHAQNVAVSEREKKREVLWSIVEAPDSSYGDKCRALDLLNKMDAEYININKTIDDTHDKLDTLDIDALKALVSPSETRSE